MAVITWVPFFGVGTSFLWLTGKPPGITKIHCLCFTRCCGFKGKPLGKPKSMLWEGHPQQPTARLQWRTSQGADLDAWRTRSPRFSLRVDKIMPFFFFFLRLLYLYVYIQIYVHSLPPRNMEPDRGAPGRPWWKSFLFCDAKGRLHLYHWSWSRCRSCQHGPVMKPVCRPFCHASCWAPASVR